MSQRPVPIAEFGHAIPVSVEEREGTEQGWSEMLERLAEDLAKA